MPILFNIFQKPEEEKTQPYLFYEISVRSCSITKSCVTLVTLWSLAHQCPWDSPGKNTGMDCHFFLQGVFLTQGTNTESPASLDLSGILFTTELPGKPCETRIS